MKPMKNRMTDLLGVEYPIIQAPMGWIARAQLASAVSNAGGLGIIETSSGQLDEVRAEIIKMRELTDKPFGVNIAQAFVRDPGIVDFVVDQGIKFVTTSAGDPNKYCGPLKAAGLTVFHVVPTLAGALKAIDAGVDGLVVEGGEGGGFKNPKDVALMVLLPLIRGFVREETDKLGNFWVDLTRGTPYLNRDAFATQPISAQHKMIETLTIFDNVFVPWDCVLLAGDTRRAGQIALTFVEYHRVTAVSYKLPLLDALIGLSVALAEANGIARTSHVRDKPTWLIGYAETVRGLTHMAAERCRIDEATGIAYPDPLTTNIAKWTFARCRGSVAVMSAPTPSASGPICGC